MIRQILSFPGTWLRPAFLSLLLLPFVAACAKGPDKTPLEVELIQTVAQQIKLRRTPAAPRPVLTRAALDETVKGAFIEVTIEDSDIQAYLGQTLIRRDDTPGELVVWRTEDQVTLTMRAGVLVATRGLRNDLLSASALVPASAAKGPGGQGERRYEVAALDNRSQSFSLVCEVVDLGVETIEIVELAYRTRHLQERCDSNAGRVVNDYWVDSRSGHMWQSRQWAGPTIGYLRIRQLTI